MSRIIVVFSLALFSLTSCNGNKAENQAMEISITAKDASEVNESQNVQDIDLYVLYDLEENTGRKIGFISLSDKYPLSEHSDSLAIPGLEGIKDKKALQYFKLDTEYRKRFLARTGISESDSVFFYDYPNNILLSFPVKKLNVAAVLSIYSYREIDDDPFTQHDYEIGFEINKTLLGKLDKYQNLVSVGKHNPFIQGQMKPIVWEKIDVGRFPLKKSKLPDDTENQNIKKANSYLYNSGQYEYFVQDFAETQNSDYIVKRHLMVMDKQNGKVIIERLFVDDEGSSPAPLNGDPDYPDSKEQWAGKLLKGKPEVIFGFEWFSFGCPNIIFLNSKEEDMYINCDNRH